MLNYLRDEVREARVAEEEPSPWCYSICLVLEFLWVHLVEVFEPENIIIEMANYPFTKQEFNITL
jgi:hypothetical protein